MEYLILILAFILVCWFFISFNRFFSFLFFGAFSGVLSLIFALIFAKNFVFLTTFSLLTALILGPPGVLSLVFFNIFLLN